MWIENKIFAEDLKQINNTECVDWEKLRNKNILITGGTGLIGYTVAAGLLFANIQRKLDLRVSLLVRNIKKAEAMYSAQLTEGLPVTFIEGSIENIPKFEGKIDYIIHGASPTASKYFVDYPVETIKTAMLGTMNLLEIAKNNNVDGFVYMSSMEVYGAPHTDDKLYENMGTTLDTQAVRSCYPEAKRLAENMCASYASEYGVPAMSIRLSQTFGAGVDVDNDTRVFAEFARCAMKKENIVLQTAGTSKRCYLYTADAATAILTVMTKGEAGQVYNAANPETYCNIVEMAELVAKEIGEGVTKVEIPDGEKHDHKFSPTHNLNLSVDKIKELGWESTYGIMDMYKRMIEVVG